MIETRDVLERSRAAAEQRRIALLEERDQEEHNCQLLKAQEGQDIMEKLAANYKQVQMCTANDSCRANGFD